MTGMPARHQSMQAVWQSTWDRLPPAEQTIFSQLSLFRGSFTAEAAEAVTGATKLQLAKLLNKSIIQFDPVIRRYSIHELLRQLGYEKLASNHHHLREAKKGNIRYYFSKLVEWDEQFKGNQQSVAISTIEADLGNLFAAWNHACALKDFASIENVFVNFYWVMDYVWGRHLEIIRAIDRLNSELAKDQKRRSSVLRLYSLIALIKWGLSTLSPKEIDKHYALVSKLLEKYPVDAKVMRKHPTMLFMLSVVSDSYLRDRSKAISLAQTSMEIFYQKSAVFEQGRVLHWLGRLPLGFPGEMHFDEGIKYAERGLILQNQIGDEVGKARSSLILADYASFQGRIEDSLASANESLLIYQKLEDQLGESLARGAFGWAYLLGGEPYLAFQTFDQARQIAKEFGYNAEWEFYVLSKAAIDAGDYANGEVYARKLLNLEEVKSFEVPGLIELSRVSLVQNDNKMALSFANKGQDLFLQTAKDIGSPYILGLLAMIHINLEDFRSAYELIVEALDSALILRHYEVTFALAAVSMFYSSQGKILEAAQIYTTVSQHAYVKGSQWFADVAGKNIEAASTKLPQSAVESAKEKGRKVDTWAVAELILEEFKSTEL